MLNRKLRYFSIVCSLLAACSLLLTASTVSARDSAGIRFGTTDFGGTRDSRQYSAPTQGHSGHYRSYRKHDGKYHSDKGNHRFSTDTGIRSDNKNSGQRSFGVGTRHHGDKHHDHHGKKYFRNHNHRFYFIPPHKRHHDGKRHHRRHHRHSGILLRYSPVIYSGSDIYYSRPAPTTIVGAPRNVAYDDDYSHVDAWAALSDYQIDTALNAFASQINRRPNDVLPKVGFALSTALSGDIETGAWAMEEALSENVTDLHYFRADEDLELIIEELLLSYQDDPLMAASLYYLQQDYIAANNVIGDALRECYDCAGVRNLQGLIKRRI